MDPELVPERKAWIVPYQMGARGLVTPTIGYAWANDAGRTLTFVDAYMHGHNYFVGGKQFSVEQTAELSMPPGDVLVSMRTSLVPLVVPHVDTGVLPLGLGVLLSLFWGTGDNHNTNRDTIAVNISRAFRSDDIFARILLEQIAAAEVAYKLGVGHELARASWAGPLARVYVPGDT